MPAFSMQVKKPAAGDPGIAARIREAARTYTASAAEVAAREAHHAAGRVEEYQARRAALEGGDPSPPPQDKRRRRRSRRPRGDGASPEGVAGQESET